MAEIDLLIKLFDTLKDSIKDVQNLSNALLSNQNSIGNYIKGLPMEDIKQTLKDHSKNSADDISSCTTTVETKTGDIMESIKGLKEKVGRMILVVIVVSAILGLGILVGGIVTNYPSKNIEKIIKESIHKAIEDHEGQEDIKFDEIKDEIKKLHQQQSE
jgi:hypothetical protein